MSDGSGFDDAGVSAGEFANEFNNAAGNGGGEEDDEEEDADGGVDAVVAPVDGVRGDNGLRDAAGNAGQPRGPGRSRNVPAGAAGFVGPPPAAGVVDPRPLAQRAPRAAAAALRVCIVEARGRAFTTPINRGRKRHADDDDDEGGMSASNIMGMMMMQQRSKQSLRDANRTAS